MKKNILYLFIPFCIKSNPIVYMQNNISSNHDQCNQNLKEYGLNNSNPGYLKNNIQPLQCNQNLEGYEFNNLYYNQHPENSSKYLPQNYFPTNDLYPTQGQFVNNYQNQNQLLTVLEKYYSIISENFKILNNRVQCTNNIQYNDCANWKLELDFVHNQFMLLKNGLKDLLDMVLQNSSELEKNYSNSVLTSIEDRALTLEENILDLKGDLNKKIIKLTKKNLKKTPSNFMKSLKKIFSEKN